VLARSVAIAVGADDVEALVELDVDLAAAVERDLDLVVALLVADLGPGDPAAAGVDEGGCTGLLQDGSSDRGLGGVVVPASGPGVRSAGARGHRERRDSDRELHWSFHRG